MPRLQILAQSVLLAVILAWPAPTDIGGAALGTPGGDVLKHVWNLWWARAEASGGVPGMRTTLVDWPTGMELFPIEPLHAALAVVLPLEPVALANWLALVNLVLVGVCAGWLGALAAAEVNPDPRAVTRASLATAALAQGSSFVAFTLHVGVGELRQAWWIPLGLSCLCLAARTRAARWFAALGLTLGAATISCFYYGFFLAIAVSVVALPTIRRDRRLLLGYALTALGATALVVPVVHAFAASYGPHVEKGGFLAWMTERFAVDTFPGASLDLPDLVWSRAGHRATEGRMIYAYTGGRYVGVLALALAAAGVRAGRRRAAPWAALAVVGIVLAMGTVVWWGGGVLKLPIVLPLVWINRALGWVAEPLNFPARFLVLTAVALAVLGGLAVARWRWLGAAVPLVLVDVAAHDLVPWPRDTTELGLSEDIAAPPGAVADLSVALAGAGRRPDFATREGAVLPSWIDADLRNRGIAAQISLGRPVQTVPVERQEMWALDGLLWTAALPLASAMVVDGVDPADVSASVHLLRARGFGSVILTFPCGGRPDTRAVQALDGALGPAWHGRCLDLWPVPPGNPDPDALAAWTAAQERRVAAMPAPTLQAAARERTVPR